MFLRKTYCGNFCTGLINKLSNVSFPLCSRAVESKNLANEGRVVLAFRNKSFALLQLFTNELYVSKTVDFENWKKNF